MVRSRVRHTRYSLERLPRSESDITRETRGLRTGAIVNAPTYYVVIGLGWALAVAIMTLVTHPASAAVLHGSSCTSNIVIAALIVSGASAGACVGFVAASLFHVGEHWEK
jgi:hypothetical protein